MKDNFSKQADSYAKFRPTYPSELIVAMLERSKKRETAWDVATGNGQVAIELAGHFETVHAHDLSAAQIAKAEDRPNIQYAVAAAESSQLEDHSMDLIVCAQALHWLDHAKFFAEVKRIGRSGGLFATWCYSLLQGPEEVQRPLGKLYAGTLGDYWDAERKYVDRGYADIEMPFDQVEKMGFGIEVEWTRKQFLGYLQSWSAVQHYIAANDSDPLAEIRTDMEAAWPEGESRALRFPIHAFFAKL